MHAVSFVEPKPLRVLSKYSRAGYASRGEGGRVPVGAERGVFCAIVLVLVASPALRTLSNQNVFVSGAPSVRRVASRLAGRRASIRVMAKASSSSRPPRDIKQEVRLIEAIRRRRPLWDHSTPMHKNVKVLVYCWLQVAGELGMTEQAVKKKWKSLRDCFYRKMKEMEKNNYNMNGNADDVKYCLWPLFDRLTFLLANKKKNSNFTNYKMTPKERELLEEVSEHYKRLQNETETIIFHVPPSPPADVIPECSSTATVNSLIENESKQKNTNISKQFQEQPLKTIKPTPNTLHEKGIIPPETMTKVTLSEPPPLRVFKHVLNVPKKTDSQTKILTEPSKKLNPNPKRDRKDSETTSDTESEADLYFFKSLLPFMRALPLEDRLRVRNGIQDLILGELEALKAKDSLMGSTIRVTTATSSVCEDRLTTTDDEDAGFEQQSHPNRPMIVKEEFEDDQTLLFEVESQDLIFEDDDNYCDKDD